MKFSVKIYLPVPTLASSRWAKNGPQVLENLFSFSVCIIETISAIHLRKTGGEGDFHSVRMSVLSMIVPTIKNCCMVMSRCSVDSERPKIAS